MGGPYLLRDFTMAIKSKLKTKEPIMKCIVETTGNFGLINTNGEYIESYRPTVTKQTIFIEQKLVRGDLKVLAKALPKDANDADFLKFYEDSKKSVPLSVEAYCATFGRNAAGELIESINETATEKKKRLQKEATDLKEKEAFDKAQKEREEKEAAENAIINELASLFAVTKVSKKNEKEYEVFSAEDSVIATGTVEFLKDLRKKQLEEADDLADLQKKIDEAGK